MSGKRPEKRYPLPRPASGEDPRFTHGLLFDIGRLIEEQGYPKIESGRDLVRLHIALFEFIYGEEGV